MRIIGGVCQGRMGWVHNNANVFDEKKWIIVEAGRNRKGTREPEKARLIYQENITLEIQPPAVTTYMEALLSQHEDIHQDMKKLVKKLVEFDALEPSSEFMDMFMVKWNEEKTKRRGRIRNTGSRIVCNWIPNGQNGEGWDVPYDINVPEDMSAGMASLLDRVWCHLTTNSDTLINAKLYNQIGNTYYFLK